MIISNIDEVRAEYENAKNRGWVLPCICTENLTTTEAILKAVHQYAIANNISGIPIILAITCQYGHRSQAANYTTTRDWKTGLKLFVADAKALADENGIYKDVHVMLHLDHIQFDADKELLESDLSDFASILFDASTAPFDENIRLTKEFVQKNGNKILVEGACDEIVDATGDVRNQLTTAQNAKRYIAETGADLVVCNLGTEHRAKGKQLHYYQDIAREIKAAIGANIVLHGASSVDNNQIKNLFDDGICKVNIWTALERDSTPILLENMVKNAVKVGGAEVVQKLIDEGYLTKKAIDSSSNNISHFTTMYRQDIVGENMCSMVKEYLHLWYK